MRSDIRMQASLTSALGGTPGSRSLPYGVIVTWNRAMWPMEAISFMRGTIGPGFFVTKRMQSTSFLCRLTR